MLFDQHHSVIVQVDMKCIQSVLLLVLLYRVNKVNILFAHKLTCMCSLNTEDTLSHQLLVDTFLANMLYSFFDLYLNNNLLDMGHRRWPTSSPQKFPTDSHRMLSLLLRLNPYRDRNFYMTTVLLRLSMYLEHIMNNEALPMKDLTAPQDITNS